MFSKEVCLIILIFCYGVTINNSEGVSSLITLTEAVLERICQGIEFQYVAHPSNQQNYIICVPGGGVEKECAAGHCFDERNPPCSANCHTNPNAADQTIKDYCNDDDTTLLDRVANDNDCESYYLCVGKNVDPLPQKCPPNQHFSEEHKTCLNYDEANCAASSKWCKNRRDGTRFTHLKCYNYYECQSETAITKSCSYGEHFDKDLHKCVNGFCPEDQRIPDCQNATDGLRIAHAKCYKYYLCLNRSLFEAQCASGFYFDKINNLCIRDANNVCSDI